MYIYIHICIYIYTYNRLIDLHFPEINAGPPGPTGPQDGRFEWNFCKNRKSYDGRPFAVPKLK